MQVECVDSRSIPHHSSLYSDFLYDFDKVSRFYASPPFACDWPSLARPDFPAERRNKLADTLEKQNRAWGASAATLGNIARLKNGAHVIVTGQQVVLFGGPLFALLKAITAVKLAHEATGSGVDAVPVFWLATEDHDLEEVSTVSLLSGSGELEKLSLASTAKAGASVAGLELGAGVSRLMEAAVGLLGDTEMSQWLKECYRPQATFGDAFARLFSRIFSQLGVVLVNASDPELHKLALPLYEAALENAPRISQAQLQRDRELQDCGYHAQVKVSQSSTLLFEIRDGVRTPVQQSNGGFSVARQKVSGAELLDRVRAEPESFSGNALFRPVVQDFLLPTLAYVGGPAEVAYFAQAAVVYQQLLGRLTPVVPRISATIVDPAIARRLSRYDLKVKDAWMPADRFHSLLGKRGLPLEVAQSFTKARSLLKSALHEIGEPLARLDPSLTQAAEKASAKMHYQLSRLEGRAARAEERRNGEIARHAVQLSNALFPHKNLQEREIAGIYFLSRYGHAFLEQMLDSLSDCCPDHQLLFV